MVWKVEFSQDCEDDLSLIFDHLFETYKDLGESDPDAFDHASERVRGIRVSAEGLAANPWRGTIRNTIGPDIRNITINKAVIWFQTDKPAETVRVLAFFFGGQDHVRHMLRRLLENR